MSKTTRTAKILTALVLAVMVALAFLPATENAAAKSGKLKMNKKTITLEAGQTRQLKVRNSKGKVKWRSANSKVATVSKGTVKGIKPGKTTITAKCHGKKAKCKVYVNGYLSVGKAYKLLNKFRTTPKVWQWRPGSKSKDYFNKPGATYLEPLAINAELEKTAKIRAKEISKRFDHVRPNGEFFFTAFPGNGWYAGENVACGQTSAKQVTKLWKESKEKYAGQGHRRNMLEESFNSVGIACYMKKGVKFWVQDFAYIIEPEEDTEEL